MTLKQGQILTFNHRVMRNLFYLLILVPFLTFNACGDASVNEDTEEWVYLFNGENLDGWDIKIAGYELNDNVLNTFRVEDGLLRVSYDDYDEWNGELGHIYYEKPFSHYRIVVEYRFNGEQVAGAPDWGLLNNGIMMHSQPAETVTMDQLLPISFEMQLLHSEGDLVRPNGNLYLPGTRVILGGELTEEDYFPSSSEPFFGEEWVRAEAVVLGDSLIQHLLNGEVVMEYSKPVMGGEGPDDYDPEVKNYGKPLTEGHIALQAETHPTDFKTIKILPLKGCMDPDAVNFKSYYVADEPEACKY
jgi:hypothetical protein